LKYLKEGLNYYKGKYLDKMFEYFTLNKVLYLIEKVSFYILIIGSVLLVVLILNPYLWDIKSIFPIVYSIGDDDNDLKKATFETLNEAKETIKTFREEGVKIDVTPTF
jgi:hypothetical protein